MRVRPAIPSLRFLGFALTFALAGAFAAGARDTAIPEDALRPRLRAEPASIEATEDLTWRVSLTLENRLDVALYPDSGQAIAEDTGPGETRVPGRTTELPLQRLVRMVPSLAPGASRTLEWTGLAGMEQGTIAFTIFAHD